MNNNQLTIFEGQELEILTKKDVNFKFEGTVLFNGKQVGKLLGYKRGAKAINDITRKNQRFKVSNSKILNQDFRKVHNTGEIFVNEKGVMKLIINSDMPKADEFEDKVWDIVTKVQQTGKFDSIEEKIKLIKDEKERKLTLNLYSLEQVLKVNPDDRLTIINRNQVKSELESYKQQKELEEHKQMLLKQEEELEEHKKKLDSIFVVGDRPQFVSEVNRIARVTGKQQSEIYNLTYNMLKSMYGIDLFTRVKNKRESLQNERVDNGKKPYAPGTLKSKINNLIVADELSIWNELGRSLNAVNQSLIKK